LHISLAAAAIVVITDYEIKGTAFGKFPMVQRASRSVTKIG